MIHNVALHSTRVLVVCLSFGADASQSPKFVKPWNPHRQVTKPKKSVLLDLVTPVATPNSTEKHDIFRSL